MKRRLAVVLLAAVILAAGLVAAALLPVSARRALAGGLPPLASAVPATQEDLDAQVRAVASRLRCPVCQNESVADSPAELAAQMRDVIRERLRRGESPEAITAYFVSRYGEWILLEPPRRGLGWVLWVGPWVLILLGAAAALRFVRRAAAPQP